MKIFNLENLPKKRSANEELCIVIGTWEEWKIVSDIVEAAAKASPRKKKLQSINEDLGHLAIY